MSITPGFDALATDFISTSSGAGDTGKVAKLDANGKIARGFVYGAYGGDGSDGALSISSGTTTIDCAGARIIVKNYTSISITGTGALAFSNPSTNGTIIILKSQGNVTITSSATRAIDLRNMGGAGSAGSDGSDAGEASDGLGINCPYPTAGTRVLLGSSSTLAYTDLNAAGAVPSAVKAGLGARLSASLALRGAAFCGAGGSAARGNNDCGKAGGRGAGGLLIQCGGALNITGTIDASGTAGTASAGSGGGAVNAVSGRGGGANTSSPWNTWGSVGSSVVGAGGGGGAGCIIILYNTLTADTGTYTVTGGAAGTTGSGLAASAGGDGFSLVAKNTELP